MKVLTIRQPWLWAIAHGTKRIENRPWRTHYRGPVLLHAAVTRTRIEYEEGVLWMRRRGLVRENEVPPLYSLPRGVVVAQATIVDCLENVDIPADSWATPGAYGIALADVKLVRQAPFVGTLRLQNAPASLIKAVAA